MTGKLILGYFKCSDRRGDAAAFARTLPYRPRISNSSATPGNALSSRRFDITYWNSGDPGNGYMREQRPQPDAEIIPAEMVRSHLEEVLSSQVFAGSERLRRFLRFLVESTLEGQRDQLKEYTVGVSVFERGPEYDPRIDPAVRVHAGKLRDRLREFY